MNTDEIWRLYFKRKIAKHKYNLDNKPFSKREKRLMQMAFKAGYGWEEHYRLEALKKKERT
jgi:hypothetical protein